MSGINCEVIQICAMIDIGFVVTDVRLGCLRRQFWYLYPNHKRWKISRRIADLPFSSAPIKRKSGSSTDFNLYE